MDTNVNKNFDFEEDKSKKNAFPVHAFRKELREIMHEYNKVMNLCYDFMGASILFAFSLAIGNHYRVQIKKKWIESCVIWIALVGKAGINKSAPLAIFIEFFRNLDSEYYKTYKAEIKEFNELIASKKGKKKNTEIAENSQDEATANTLQSPRRKQFLISDFTPEALSTAHEDNPSGIGIYSDELLTWINNFNRYTKSGEEQFYLSVWSCREININRRNSPHIYISNPFINVTGTIQPEKLIETFGKGRDSSGFTHRILFAFPEEIKREDLSDVDVPEIYMNTYNGLLGRILEKRSKLIELQGSEPKILPLDINAAQIFKEWRRKNNARINESNNDSICGIYSKIEIYLLRIALIIQIIDDVLDNKDSDRITSSAILSSIEFVNYFEENALKVNKLISKYNDPLANYSLDKRLIYMALPNEFTTSNGEEISNKYNMPRRTFFDFLKDDYLFTKLKHGTYSKKV